MALVPAAPAPPSTLSRGDLVPYDGPGALGEPLERRMERLRGDREAHSRKQIWTKEPHGGAYRKVNANKGYDPLIQLPDGSDRQAELGYERVKTGPTSNFVGNHMTQGAIDLVQAQLEPPPAPPPLLTGSSGLGPRLLQASAEAGLPVPAAPPPRPLQQYRWVDEDAAVCLEVPTEQMQLGAAGATVSCSVQADRLELVVATSCGSPEAGVDGGRSGSGSTAAQAASYWLLVHPLQAAVVPDRCSCYLKGLQALPACADSTVGDAASLEPPGKGPDSGQQGSSPSPQQLHSISFTLSPTATAVVVVLAKATQEPWESLQAALPVVPSIAAGGGSSKPDLVAMRKAIRQQLNRASPVAASGSAGDVGAPSAAAAAASVANTPVAADPKACHRIVEEAEAMVTSGRHANALATTVACLGASPGAELAVRLHALRGHCHAQLGCLKPAVGEYTAAAELAAAAGMADQRCQLLLARASLLEQQEQLEAALADVQEAAKLQQAPFKGVLLTKERLRRAVRRARRGA